MDYLCLEYFDPVKKVFTVNKIGFSSGSSQTKLSQDSHNSLLLN